MTMNEYQQPPPRSKLIWVGVDLDGTIAEPVWTPANPTSDIGDPIERNLEKLRELGSHGYKIVIHTSRPWTDYEGIEYWLNFHGVLWDQIQCGKPLFALYVDDRGRHESAASWLPKPGEDELHASFAAERQDLAQKIHRKVNSSRIGATVPYTVGDADRAVAAVIEAGWAPAA